MVKIFFADCNLPLAYVIRFFTWSDFSHVGLVDLDKGEVLDARFSKGGVSTYAIADLYHSYHTIVFVEPPCDADKLWGHAASEIGKGYDWGGIFGMALRRDWQADDKWFCSEHVAAAIAQELPDMFAKHINRVTPGLLFDMLWRGGKETVKWRGQIQGGG